MVGRIAVVSSAPVKVAELGFDSVAQSISAIHMTGTEDRLPSDATGLFIYAPNHSSFERCLGDLVFDAMDADVPILASASGMHCLNIALGGRAARDTPSHIKPDGSRRHRVLKFMAMGAKTSSTIGGSGWLSSYCDHSKGISQSRLAPDVMASIIAQDLTVEAFEMPGHHWVIGVQWDVFCASRMPRGFDSILIAFMERVTVK